LKHRHVVLIDEGKRRDRTLVTAPLVMANFVSAFAGLPIVRATQRVLAASCQVVKPAVL
jgi:hypothetical protein